MNAIETLSDFHKIAENDAELRALLLGTQDKENPLKEFCKIARSRGFDLYEMDVIDAGEELAATMKRSVNGGGENSPDLKNSDDYYEMFIDTL